MGFGLTPCRHYQVSIPFNHSPFVKTTQFYLLNPTNFVFLPPASLRRINFCQISRRKMRRPAYSSPPINFSAVTRKIDVDNRLSLRNYYRIADNLLKQVSKCKYAFLVYLFFKLTGWIESGIVLINV